MSQSRQSSRTVNLAPESSQRSLSLLSRPPTASSRVSRGSSARRSSASRPCSANKPAWNADPAKPPNVEPRARIQSARSSLSDAVWTPDPGVEGNPLPWTNKGTSALSRPESALVRPSFSPPRGRGGGGGGADDGILVSRARSAAGPRAYSSSVSGSVRPSGEDPGRRFYGSWEKDSAMYRLAQEVRGCCVFEARRYITLRHFTGSSCANNGKDELNNLETLLRLSGTFFW
eukprot:360398-Pyramimonas_sp.AAC.1